MDKPKLQKTFYCSSEQIKNMIETRINSIATEEERTTSYTIEQILLDALFPINSDARFIVMINLNSNNGISDTLADLFSYNAGGMLPMCSRHTNLKPLLEFVLENVSIEVIHPCPEHYEDWMSELESIIEVIDKCACCCIEENDRNQYMQFSQEAHKLHKMAMTDNNELYMRPYLVLMRDCWDILNGRAIFDTFLCLLMRMSNVHPYDYIHQYNKLIKVITDVSNEW